LSSIHIENSMLKISRLGMVFDDNALQPPAGSLKQLGATEN